LYKAFFFIVLAGIFISSGTADQTETPPDTQSAVTIETLFPMGKEWQWRYESKTRDGISHYTTRYRGTFNREGEVFHLLSNPYGVSYYQIGPDALKVKGVAPAEDLKNVNFYTTGDLTRLKYPLKKGDRWRGRALLDRESDSVITNYATEIIGWETITVPSGTYDALATSSTVNTIFVNREKGFGKGMISRENQWYAPGVGLVRRTINFMYEKDKMTLYRDDRLQDYTHPR